jgi:hypothetical protein
MPSRMFAVWHTRRGEANFTHQSFPAVAGASSAHLLNPAPSKTYGAALCNTLQHSSHSRHRTSRSSHPSAARDETFCNTQTMLPTPNSSLASRHANTSSPQSAQHPHNPSRPRNIPQKPNEPTAQLPKPLQHLKNAISRHHFNHFLTKRTHQWGGHSCPPSFARPPTGLLLHPRNTPTMH